MGRKWKGFTKMRYQTVKKETSQRGDDNVVIKTLKLEHLEFEFKKNGGV